MEHMLGEVLIIGIGLIGGSLGLALQGSELVRRITGVDAEPEVVAQALEIGAIDETASMQEAVERAGIIFLCTSPAAYPELLQQIRPWLRPGTLLSDVGSTKKDIVELFQDLPPGVTGIGGHPMAGSETAGIQGADRYLFENAVYVLTPHQKAHNRAIDELTALLGATGARIQIMDAVLHDRIVARVSHIPHLAAVALVNLTGGDSNTMMMAAGGFRDTTRVASSNPALWEDIIFSNRGNIVAELDSLIAELAAMKDAIADNDSAAVRLRLQEAKRIRDQIPRLQRTYLGSTSDIICIVPDEPGIIGRLGQILGEYQVNIVDLEILRVREGDGGTIRIAVPDYEAATRAVAALQIRGIKAWTK